MRIPLAGAGLALLLFALALGGCSDGDSTQTIVIDENCNVKDDCGVIFDKLPIYAGCDVKWVNEWNGKVDVSIDDAAVFGTSAFTLSAHETKTTPVRCGSGTEATVSIRCEGGPSNGPRVVVEDPP